MGYLTEQLQELIVVDGVTSNRTGNPINTHYPVSRIALRRLLLAGLEDVVRFDKVFERYECTRDGKVTAYFTDGTSATGDVLVGADGANSKVRKQYLPQASRVELGVMGVLGGKLLLTGQTRAWLPSQLMMRTNLIMPPDRYFLASFPIDRVPASAEALNSVCEKAKAAGLNPELLIDNTPDHMLWGFFAPINECSLDMRCLDGHGLQRVVGEMMEGWHPDVCRLVAESDPSSISVTSFKASTLIGPWESSNVTLLGDSIHNMPPVGGLGGNMALRDACSLANALTVVERGKLPLVPAIQAYEAEMREYGFAAVRTALRRTEQMVMSNRIERSALRTYFRICNTVPPLKRAFESKWIAAMMRNRPRPTSLK
jgi:2-polyprenyl-6-methoxyphenol hydroxylase-like FAD-dependent oxidoreductase